MTEKKIKIDLKDVVNGIEERLKNQTFFHLNQAFPELEDTTLQEEDAFYCGVVFMKFPDDINV